MFELRNNFSDNHSPDVADSPCRWPKTEGAPRFFVY